MSNRRDLCHELGTQMNELPEPRAAMAWDSLSRHIIKLGDKDVPKFKDLIEAIRIATENGRAKNYYDQK